MIVDLGLRVLWERKFSFTIKWWHAAGVATVAAAVITVAGGFIYTQGYAAGQEAACECDQGGIIVDDPPVRQVTE